MWEYENPHAVVKHIHDSTNINVWCRLMHAQITGQLFSTEETVTRQVYLEVYELFLSPQVKKLQPLIFQQDGAPPYQSATEWELLN
jgi:hypothetical protein